MKHTLFDLLNFISSNSLIIYPIVFFCVCTACITIYNYSPRAISYYTKTPRNIIITVVGYVIYQLMHIISSKVIQSLFYMSPNQLPHTVTILTLILCIPVWLFLISIWIKGVRLYFSFKNKEFKFFQDFGLGALSILLMMFSCKFIINLLDSQEFIKQIAVYTDYVDKGPGETVVAAADDDYDGFLIIDDYTISVYRKFDNEIQFKTIKNLG